MNWKASHNAEWQDAVHSALLNAFGRAGEDASPSPAAYGKIREALGYLSPKEEPGVLVPNVPYTDRYFARYLAGLEDYTTIEGVVSRALIRRHRAHVPHDLAKAALEEICFIEETVAPGEIQARASKPLFEGLTVVDFQRLEDAKEDEAPAKPLRVISCGGERLEAVAHSEAQRKAVEDAGMMPVEGKPGRYYGDMQTACRIVDPDAPVSPVLATATPAPAEADTPQKTKKPVPPIKVYWHAERARWEAKTHRAAQQDAVSAAGFQFDPGVMRYQGDAIAAGKMREHIRSAEDLERLERDLAPPPVAPEPEPPFVIADAQEHPVAPRKRGRPSNAALGKPPALSQVERNKRYRAGKAKAVVELPADLADRLRAARKEKGMTTEQLLAAALEALGV